MRFVPVKDEAQQANAVVFRARDLLVRQRTQCINALRGHLAEYGHVVPQVPAPQRTIRLPRRRRLTMFTARPTWRALAHEP